MEEFVCDANNVNHLSDVDVKVSLSHYKQPFCVNIALQRDQETCHHIIVSSS